MSKAENNDLALPEQIKEKVFNVRLDPLDNMPAAVEFIADWLRENGIDKAELLLRRALNRIAEVHPQAMRLKEVHFKNTASFELYTKALKCERGAFMPTVEEIRAYGGIAYNSSDFAFSR